MIGKWFLFIIAGAFIYWLVIKIFTVFELINILATIFIISSILALSITTMLVRQNG